MFNVLNGMQVVEGASFIAAPSAGLHLLQLGAEVIRFDMIGGGPDFHRWPVTAGGASLYWEGLNKGKKSIAIDLSRPEGQELAQRLVTAPGEERGLFVTNFPPQGFLSHAHLAELRPDLITLRVMGWADGDTAVDYTVNAALGVPAMTGPEDGAPVNHVLPAWDLLAGAYGASALLAAERHRRESGKGQEVRLPLAQLALAMLGALGQIGEVVATGKDRPPYGNALFGAFGRDFLTRDGRRLMVVAITTRQWTGLVEALGLAENVAALEAELGVSFTSDEGARFEHRDRLFPLVEAAIAARDASDIEARFDACKVCWGPYRGLAEALERRDRFAMLDPLAPDIAHPSGLSYPTPGAAADFAALQRGAPRPAPQLGAHTDEVLAQVLRLPEHEIARLHDDGLVAGATPT